MYLLDNHQLKIVANVKLQYNGIKLEWHRSRGAPRPPLHT